MNPYQPPQAPYQGQGQGPVGAGACPQCRGGDVYKPSFTWWGGILGPKILNHWVCRSCGFGFNPNTGRSTTGGIVIYFVVVTVIALGLVFAITRR